MLGGRLSKDQVQLSIGLIIFFSWAVTRVSVGLEFVSLALPRIMAWSPFGLNSTRHALWIFYLPFFLSLSLSFSVPTPVSEEIL
ncbi:hypothetical protein HOY80DRAFT_977048 [Tuber brumale]|nr:hypothetical protein HOY80DRAFT_977048 [Tuber brumale]